MTQDSTESHQGIPRTTPAVLITDVRPYGEQPRDLLIDGPVIAGVFDPRLRPLVLQHAQPARVIAGHGLVVVPAFVDLHVHLREPGGSDQETIATGLAAAAAGGFSDVFAMANTNPVTDTPERVQWMREQAEQTSRVRAHPVGSITIGLAGERVSPIEELADAGVTLFSDDGKCVDDAGLMQDALQRTGALGLTVAQHAQSHALAGSGQLNAGFAAERTGLAPWPVSGEAAIVARDSVLAAETGGHLHVCHVSTRRTVEVVRAAKANGWPVSTEVTPHHLLLTDELSALASPTFKVNPPLRSADDVHALRAALTDGVIETIGTDHAPHTVASKSCGWSQAAFGMTGLETALPVVASVTAVDGVVDWRMITHIMHDRPAAIGSLPEVANSAVRAGDPATLVFVDEQQEQTVDGASQHTKGLNTPFQGVTFGYQVVATLIDGEQVHGSLI
ncbi:dihydroorotase [Pseudoclavibacter sp. CFCC 13611]|uniref:dihydroorotase n=1 Tax=Pseudoclavibacter sp. CFCC 13611 TaxID=2615178 RepID=UPI001301051A|nr:dihydroorotase [Pseudoclavibacter sp. CFCC 13611]KAB1662666.1 dihydroorotase [Pseudoclavibacter sp. CFCC 13611]